MPKDDAAPEPRGPTLAERIDALHTRHFADTALGHHTLLWNAVSAFTDDIKKLVAETEPPAAPAP